MLLETNCYHIEQWMDCLKMCYFMKKIHRKQKGKMYKALKIEIVNSDTSGFVGDLRKLCEKYDIPDLTLLPLRTQYIKSACKDLSRRKCLTATLINMSGARADVEVRKILGKIFEC